MQTNTWQNQNSGKIHLPPTVFGTSCLGNIYHATSHEQKQAIVEACMKNSPARAVFDSAGKYGAGLALKSLGKSLDALNVDPKNVVISNKLGWYQVPLTTPEPTFEPGIWKDLTHDAVQRISYEGILECFYQGNELLGPYTSQLASVHDPDEYLAKAQSIEEENDLYADILGAYRALAELKASGEISGIGVGAKQWGVIERISKDVALDWVMIANSLTLHDHPRELLEFISGLHNKGVTVINSAVFNGGFLVGSDYYNYGLVDKNTPSGKSLYAWRSEFWRLCEQFGISPAHACLNFGFTIPGVSSVAVSTTNAAKVKQNIDMVTADIPEDFWHALKRQGLIDNPIL
ncbi:aldo/keto reductase [Dyadobacter subterraneus]|uniref:Aldo/keto reductase n=1 Tax=Dyadobacter subterraneus TaxID=2773304 RepID=A0ABR9WB67_9BACT|nr:aldo/keto reductase [Dyadobacter subterraneus]MBE9462712.1 aldo/keto reductase [Dyadobacter subterraneus]